MSIGLNEALKKMGEVESAKVLLNHDKVVKVDNIKFIHFTHIEYNSTGTVEASIIFNDLKDWPDPNKQYIIAELEE